MLTIHIKISVLKKSKSSIMEFTLSGFFGSSYIKNSRTYSGRYTQLQRYQLSFYREKRLSVAGSLFCTFKEFQPFFPM